MRTMKGCLSQVNVQYWVDLCRFLRSSQIVLFTGLWPLCMSCAVFFCNTTLVYSELGFTDDSAVVARR